MTALAGLLALAALLALVAVIVRVWGAIELRRTEPGVAVPWDGVGPQNDCLVRIVELGSTNRQWVHVEFLWSDGVQTYLCAESGRRVDELRPGIMITHYAQFPEVRP